MGAMSTIFTGDYFGRPRQILVGSAVIAVGAIIQTASCTVAQMYVGRIIAGLGRSRIPPCDDETWAVDAKQLLLSPVQ